MFYKLFENSEFNHVDIFIEYINGNKNAYKDLKEIGDEYNAYKNTFENNLYKYKPKMDGEKKTDYCLGDNINLQNTIKTMTTVIEDKTNNNVKSKEEFEKVENGNFSFNVIDTSILAINFNDGGRKDYTSKFLKCLFKYFGLDYDDLHQFKKGKNTEKTKIKKKWLGMIAFFSLKDDTNHLLSNYPFIENEGLLFIIEYIIDNYTLDFIAKEIYVLYEQIHRLIGSVEDMIDNFSNEGNNLEERMQNAIHYEEHFLYDSYYTQLQMYKDILHSILEIVDIKNPYQRADELKDLLLECPDDMNVITKILINQLITVKFLTKLYDKVFHAYIFFRNSIATINE